MRNYKKGLVKEKQKFMVGTDSKIKLDLWSLGLKGGNGEVPSTNLEFSG
jgi:hypothetical protein